MQNRWVWVVLVVIIIVTSTLFYLSKSKITPPLVVVPTVEKSWPSKKVIGSSVEKRQIDSYTYGEGDTHLLFVGGIHGGYEWNSVELANKLIDHLNQNKDLIPENISVTIIPNANPDGYEKSKGEDGRFNANGVDLNRNFDCKWKATSTWKSKVVSAGTSAFSEPEAQALRSVVLDFKPEAVVFWHSKANAVYASECENGILPKTIDVMNIYSKVSGYKAVDSFDAYPITGDAEGWLASIGIPAITVELSTHETIEWERNLAGIKALLEYFK